VDNIESQINDPNEIELIVLVDNKSRTIGEKRQALKSMARGKYFCMIDDDDAVMDTFCDDLVDAIKNVDVDVISFDSVADIDGKVGVIEMSLEHKENEQFKPDGVTHRPPWHMCAWKRDIFQKCKFDTGMYGEDWTFVERCLWIATTEHHIDKVLHKYEFRSDVTEAFERKQTQ
jgi:glycosyltransferase involved in cell wall biosynthesis